LDHYSTALESGKWIPTTIFEQWVYQRLGPAEPRRLSESCSKS